MNHESRITGCNFHTTHKKAVGILSFLAEMHSDDMAANYNKYNKRDYMESSKN